MDSNRFQGIREIRNGAYLLSLGNAYLCEAPFLIKIGENIHSQIDGLKGDITAIKDQFPGKFLAEIDTDAVLAEISALSLHLQNPDQALNEKCTIGELGNELETLLEKLTTTLDSLRNQVEGRGLTYSTKDSFLAMFGGVRQSGGYAASRLKMMLKVIGVVIVLCAVAFFSLFLTMENEKDILGKITAHQAHIRSQQEILSELDREMQALIEQAAPLEKDNATRQEKLEYIELNMKIHDLEQRRQQVQEQIQTQRNEIKTDQAEIKAMKKKSFLERLLRQ